MNPSISSFVHEALSRGLSREAIAAALQKGGWSAKEIGSALDAFVDCDLPLPVPRKQVSASPKEAFLFLMLFGALYTAAFQLGSMLFDLINLSLPEPGESVQRSIWSLRYGIASVMVAFPILLLMGRVIANESQCNPGQRISPVRRWLTYLTLFVASVSIIANLIVLLVRFLEGDVTLRFGLKVIVVAVLAGAAFLYYLRDMRRDEVAPSAVSGPERGARMGVAALTAVVVVTIGIGFWFAGSPMKARLLAQDAARVGDLADISLRVQRYYSDKGVLPESLAACDANPDTFIARKQDRVTGEPYVYHVVDAAHFAVGATFALPGGSSGVGAAEGREMLRVRGESDFWEHPAGAKTFVIDAANVKEAVR